MYHSEVPRKQFYSYSQSFSMSCFAFGKKEIYLLFSKNKEINTNYWNAHFSSAYI